MNHKNFIEKYNSKEITVNVDINKAGYMYEQSNLMPQKFRIKQTILRMFGFIGLITGIVLFFFIQWWIALGVMIIALSIFPIMQKTAGSDVLFSSLENSNVYEVAVNNKVLIINKTMTKDEIFDIQTNGLKLLESIEAELIDKKIGYEKKFETFEGNYMHYREFFKELRNFRDLDNYTCMFFLIPKEITIAVTIGKVESENLMYISAKKI